MAGIESTERTNSDAVPLAMIVRLLPLTARRDRVSGWGESRPSGGILPPDVS
jgi:hypothetical protein